MEAVPRQNHIELICPEWESSHISDVPRQVPQAQLGLEGGRTFNHRGSQVEARDLTGHPSGGTRDSTGAARDIQHLIRARNLGHPEEQLSRLFVAWKFRKVNRLATELIDDLAAMLVLRVHDWQHFGSDGPTSGLRHTGPLVFDCPPRRVATSRMAGHRIALCYEAAWAW